MGANVEELAEPLRTAVKRLLDEANAGASTPRVTVVSARRTRAEQEALWRANPDPAKVAPPGTSKHETGQAVDFGGDLDLVARLAPRYGLSATVAGEPWHYEFTFGTQGKPIGLTDVPAVALGAGVAAAGDAAAVPAAIGSFVSAATSPRTWLRAFGAVAGLGLVGIGLYLIAGDLGVPVTPRAAATAAVGNLTAAEAAAVGSSLPHAGSPL